MNKPFVVAAPFDSDPNADVVLRSSDCAEFKAVKGLLSYASPIFKDMFSLPPSIGTGGCPALPVVDLSESAFVIDMLLRFIYPVNVVIDGHNTQLFAVYEAARKYEMACVLTRFEANCRSDYEVRPQNAILLYVIACANNDSEAAAIYAWDCLRLPNSSLAAHWPSSTSVDCFMKLLSYHHAVSAKLGIRFSDANALTMVLHGSLVQCSVSSPCRIIRSTTTPLWWQKEHSSRLLAIIQSGPLSEDVYSFKTNFASINTGCNTCTISLFNGWAKFEKALKTCLETDAKQVPFKFLN